MASQFHSMARAQAHAPSHVPNRRALLGGLAVVPLAAQAQPAHPDAELLELEHHRVAVDAAHRNAVDRAFALVKVGVPEAPEAMFLRESDHALGLGSFATQRSDGRAWFYLDTDGHKAGIRKARTRIETRAVDPKDNLPSEARTVDARVLWPEAQVRADEIVAAFTGWRAALDRAQQESGHQAASNLADKLGTKLSEVEGMIESSTPQTLEGLAIKASHLQRLFDGGVDTDEYMIVVVSDILSVASALSRTNSHHRETTLAIAQEL